MPKLFYSIEYCPFQLDTQDILSNLVFPKNKWLLGNNLIFNNFLCMSASIFVFITLIVSTQARHLNTWLAQILVKTLVCLATQGIFYSWELLVLWCFLESATETSLSVQRKFSWLHDCRYGPLVSVCFQMNYLLFHLQYQRQYRYCPSPNCSTHYSRLTLLFTLLLMWCSAGENS